MPADRVQIGLFDPLTFLGNVSVHWREEGCIGKYVPRGPRDSQGRGFGGGPRGAKSRPEGNHQHKIKDTNPLGHL